ncbi:MAG: hypothetical protein Q9207_005938 [Kuettlingeria erythrocarpa]
MSEHLHLDQIGVQSLPPNPANSGTDENVEGARERRYVKVQTKRLRINLDYVRCLILSALVRIIVANFIPYARTVYNEDRGAPMPIPMVIGSAAIGRIESVGVDATFLSPGQFVFVDTSSELATTRPQASSSDIVKAQPNAARNSWQKHGETQRRLLGKPDRGGLGYQIEDLAFLNMQVVPYGGLRDLNIQAGDTVNLAPATGSFGGAAVQLAVAMGARFIAAGRNLEVLKQIAATSDRHLNRTPEV